MTSAKEVATAIEVAFARAMRRHPLNGDEVRKMLRVEATHDAVYDILHGTSWQYRNEMMPEEGPRTLHGVAVYTVDKLPAPGWRVIDPLA